MLSMIAGVMTTVPANRFFASFSKRWPALTTVILPACRRNTLGPPRKAATPGTHQDGGAESRGEALHDRPLILTRVADRNRELMVQKMSQL